MSLPGQLHALESSNLIRLAQVQPELEYLFRHALVQEAAYTSLVKEDRRHLHSAVGQALERAYPDRLGELASLLAKHFDEAGDTRRALDYFTRAGDAAAAVYANAEAVMHFARALEIARRDDANSDVLCHLYLGTGRALELSAQDDRALLNYGEMEITARERGDRAMELAALLARATVYLKPAAVRDPERGRELSARALALSRGWGDRASEAKSLWNLMQFYKWTGQSPQAMAHAEQALAIARELDLRELMAYVLNDLVSVCLIDGRFQRAREVADEAQRLWRELGVLNMLADSLASAAELRVMAGEYESAVALSGEALRISQSIGNLWNQSYSWYLIDLAFLDRGEIGRAIAAAEECLRLGQQAGFMAGVVQAGFDLTLIYRSLGAVRRAAEAAERVRHASQDLALIGPLHQVMSAQLHLLGGKLGAARQALDEARRSAGEEPLSAYAAWFVGLTEAELLLAEGDYPGVVAVADEAIPFFRQTGIRLFLADVYYDKGIALLRLGRANEAGDTLDAARSEAEAVGSRRMLWQILAALSEIETQRGRHAEAEALRDQAREIVAFIADHAPADLRDSFLNLPDVARVMRDW